MAGSATLRLSRSWWGVQNHRRTWDIEIDGRVVGSIASQQTVELSVEPGRHSLRLSADRQVSHMRSFQAADGQSVAFRCRGPMFWPLYVAALVTHAPLIILKLG